MASNSAKVLRRAQALNELERLSELLAENLKVEMPDVMMVRNRDPELAQILHIEAINGLLARVLEASGFDAKAPELVSESSESKQEPEDLGSMTKAELLDVAEQRGVGATKYQTKAEIIESIEAAALEG